MKRFNKVLAGILTFTTLLSAIPVSAYNINVPSTMSVDDENYVVNVSITGDCYSEETMSVVSACKPDVGNIATQLTLTQEEILSGTITKDVDISAVLDGYRAYTGKSDLSGVVFGDVTANFINEYTSASINSNTEKASISFNIAEYFNSTYLNSSVINTNHNLGTINVTIKAYFDPTLADIPDWFHGHYNHGYIPSITVNRNGYSYTMPTINQIENPNKVPVLLITDYNYNVTGRLPESEIIWLDCDEVISDPDPSGSDVFVDDTEYNSINQTGITKSFSVDSSLTYDTDKYKGLYLTVDGFNMDNPNSVSNSDAGTECYKSNEVTSTINGVDYLSGIDLNLKCKFLRAENPNDASSYFSCCYGINNLAVYVVKYEAVENNIKKYITDYYNVFNNDKDNAEYITTVTVTNDNGNITTEGTEPSREIEGWTYRKETSEVINDNTYGVQSHKVVYRFYTQLFDKNFTYKLKYKAVWNDGTPASGITLKDETTDTNGFISGVDTFEMALTNINSVYNTDDVFQYYTTTEISLTPSDTDTVINFASVNPYRSNETTNYSITASWNIPYNAVELDENKLPREDYRRYTYNGNPVTFSDGEDAFTKICVVNVGVKPVTETLSIPVTVKYNDNSYNTITTENTTLNIEVVKENDWITNAPLSVSLNSYSISSGIEAVKTHYGVAKEDLLLSYQDIYTSSYADSKIVNANIDTEKLNAEVSVTYANAWQDISDYGIEICLNFEIAAYSKIIVHFEDSNGNRIHDDVTYKITSDNYYNYAGVSFVEKIENYTPTGEIIGTVQFPVSICNISAFESYKGDKTGDLDNTAYFDCYMAPTDTITDEITVIYSQPPRIKIYEVLNWDYDNASYLGEVIISDTENSTSVSINSAYYNQVAISNKVIQIKQNTTSGYTLKGYNWETKRGSTSCSGSSKIITSDTKLYICYVQSLNLKVIDELYDINGVLDHSYTRSNTTYSAGYNYNISYDSDYVDEGYLIPTPSSYSGTLTTNTTLTFKYYPVTYTVKVIDEYYDEDNNFIRSNERSNTAYVNNDNYAYYALSPTGYSVIANTNVNSQTWTDATESYNACISGVVYNSDDTVTFKYRKNIEYKTITVHDEYRGIDNSIENTNTRPVLTVRKGTTYSLDALSPTGYTVIGQTNYSGTASDNVEVTFVYKKNSYTVKVKDIYQNESGIDESTSERLSETKAYGDSYSYNSLTPVRDGYELIGESNKSGTVTDNIEVVFTYKKIPSYTVTVKDKYLDIDGVEERTDTRLQETHLKDYNYSYNALAAPEGYELIGDSHVEGTLTNNIEIVFIYKAIKYYTVTVKDNYYSVDGNLQRSNERLTVSNKRAGDHYSYSALSPVPDGYVVTSDTSYSGVVADDTVVTFTYREDSARFVTVKGYITYEDGTPIANKRIEIHSTPRYTTTDANGYYEVNYVEVGDHSFTIFANDDPADNTPLVTCDLSVTRPDEDTVRVTFKTDDCEVETDTSITNVLKIDAILPVYTITVKDEYYNGSTLERSDIRTTASYKAGETYAYSALSPSGYSIDGVAEYTGICLGNMDLVFKYVKNTTPAPSPAPITPDPIVPDPEPTQYRLKVIDNYFDNNYVLQDSNVRVNNLVTAGTPYDYYALEIDHYTVSGANYYSGIVNSDITLIFNYIQEKEPEEPKRYMLKVIDAYYDKDNHLESKDVRFEQTVNEGYEYYFKAFNIDDYSVTGVNKASGRVLQDTTIVFKYNRIPKVVDKPQPKPDEPKPDDPKPDEPKQPKPEPNNDPVPSSPEVNEYTVTVIDKYIIGKKTYKYHADYIKELGDDVTVTKIANGYEVSVARVIKDNYEISAQAIARCIDTYKEGTSYQYSALENYGWRLVSNRNYSGVVDKNITLEFIYAKGFDIDYDIPLDKIDGLIPTIPFEDEPKTGTGVECNAVPYIIFFGTVIIAAFIIKRRRKRI